jgi:hypothetical protein
MPVKGEGAKARYPWPEIFHWLTEQLERRARDAAKPPKFGEAKSREMAAKAELAELDVAVRRDELMTVAQYDERIAAAFGRVRAQLLTLPTKMAPEMVGLARAQDALPKVQVFVDDIMGELHAGADVPSELDDTDGG